MSSSYDQVVIPYATFVERRERRHRNAAVLHVCDRWDLEMKAVAIAKRSESTVPGPTQLEPTGDEADDS